jgi:RND family efflux transporter MFP subunit
VESLDPGSLPANVLQAQSDLVKAEHDMENLRQSQVNLAKAQVTAANAQKSLNNALVAQSFLNAPNANPSNIEKAQAALDTASIQLTQAEQVYSMFEGRAEDDVQRLQAASQVERAKRMKEYAEINLQYAQNKPDVLTASRVYAAIDVAKATLNDAMREVERLKNGATAEDIAVVQARIDAAKLALSQSQLVAPISGTITQLTSKVGDVVSPGNTALRLEDMTEMHVRAQVPEVDISLVKVGQAAKVVFDAIPKQEYEGRVLEISQFGEQQQGNVTFAVEVSLDNSDRSIKTGLTGAVTIIIDQTSDAILIPNRAVRFVNGERTVSILQNGKVIPVPVKLGITDEANSQLVSGNLAVGDTIILNPPEPTPGS